MTTAEQPPPEGGEQPPQNASGEGIDDSQEAQDPDSGTSARDS
ncbi:hypothetical protein [Mycobacterium kubicae]|nr:hypothetical protein [Mycobacterium kubicae]